MLMTRRGCTLPKNYAFFYYTWRYDEINISCTLKVLTRRWGGGRGQGEWARIKHTLNIVIIVVIETVRLPLLQWRLQNSVTISWATFLFNNKPQTHLATFDWTAYLKQTFVCLAIRTFSHFPPLVTCYDSHHKKLKLGELSLYGHTFILSILLVFLGS